MMESTDFKYEVYEDIPIKDEPITETSEACASTWQTPATRHTGEESHIKCGEIFIEPGQTYVLICSLCSKQFNNLESFGNHINSEHLNELQMEYKPFEGLTFDQGPTTSNEKNIEQDALELYDTKPEPELLAIPKDSIDADEITNSDSKDTDGCFSCTLCPNKYKHRTSYNRHLRTRHDILTSFMKEKLENEAGEDILQCTDDEENSQPVEHKVDTKSIVSPEKKDPMPAVEGAMDVETNEECGSESGESKNGTFSCSICGCKYKHRHWYNKHLRMRHGTQENSNVEHLKAARFVCTMCGRSYSRNGRLAIHVKRDHGPEAFVNMFSKNVRCKYCGEMVSNEQTLAAHIESSHPGDNKYTCSYCEKSFLTRNGRGRHINSHHINQEDSNNKDSKTARFTCTLCRRSYSRKYRLAIHVKLDHGPEVFKSMFSKKTRCKYCEEIVSNREALAAHIESIHPGDNKYSCSHCEKSFKTRDGLQRHINLHIGLQLKCPHCPKTFTNNTILTAHIRIHLRNKYTYRCRVCNKRFINSSELSVHQQIHVLEKPHQCELCGKCFKKKGDFNRHRAIHM